MVIRSFLPATALIASIVFACSGDDENASPTSAGDAGSDVTGDAAPIDTGAPATEACFPPDLMPPKTGKVCTTDEIIAVVDGCYEAGSSTAKCNTARGVNAACTSCLISKDTDDTWGPWVENTKFEFDIVTGNAAGCLAINETDAAKPCAKAAHELAECAATSCCDRDTVAAYDECVTSAGCDDGPVKTCMLDVPSGRQCFAAIHGSARDALIYLGTQFCGGVVKDASVDSD